MGPAGMQSDSSVQWIELGWNVLQGLLTAGVWCYAWVAARDRARRDELEKLRESQEERFRGIKKARDAQDERQKKLEREVATLQERIEHLPTDADITELTSSISGLKARVEGAMETIERVDRRTNRIEDWLLSSAGRGAM